MNSFGSSGYGSGFSSMGGAMRGPFLESMGSFGSSMGSSSGYSGGLIPAAVQSRRSIQFVDTPTIMAAPMPLTLEVPPSQQPVNFLFRAQSSPLNLDSTWQGLAGSYQETSSVDEPQVRMHTVTRPVIQKQTEIITPYRKIVQEVQPVQEEVTALVTRGVGGGYQGQAATKDYQSGLLPGSALGYQTTGSTGFSRFIMGSKPAYTTGMSGSTFAMPMPSKTYGY